MTQTPRWAGGWAIARGLMGVLIVAAIAAQLVRSVSSAVEAGRDVTTIVTNFFSFFTILSNASAAVALLWAALWYWSARQGPGAEPRGLATFLAAVTTYMIVTGIVYNLLLRGYQLEPGSIVPWSNEILHLIGPLFLLGDVFAGPRRRALSWHTLWTIVAFPIAWVAYTMLRGPHVTDPGTGTPFWYPYPFLNPNGAGGWFSVALYTIGIACAILAVAALVVWRGRRAGSTDPRLPG